MLRARTAAGKGLLKLDKRMRLCYLSNMANKLRKQASCANKQIADTLPFGKVRGRGCFPGNPHCTFKGDAD
jgi:hypothetical protein